MGSCFGKCSCSYDCFVLKPCSSIPFCKKLHTPTLVFRRQTSTIEFENLMFDLDIPQLASILRLQPSNLSSLVAQNNESDIINKKLFDRNLEFEKLTQLTYDLDTSPSNLSKQMPIFDPLRNCHLKQWSEIDVNHELTQQSVEGSLEFDNEIFIYGDYLNGMFELEWDDYDQDNFTFNLDNESLMKKSDNKFKE